MRLALCRDFALDVLERLAAVSVKIGVAECPALAGGWMSAERGSDGGRTNMFAELVVVGVFDLVKVVLVQLAHEAGKVGVLEHAGQDRLCELVHVLARRLDEGQGG